MNKWSPVISIISESLCDYHYRSLQYNIIETNNDLTLIEIKENEFRSSKQINQKSPNLYYSRIIKSTKKYTSF